jgi:hypothetical protein
MIDKHDIIARLQNGDTMDEIVDDITKTINDAQDEYKAIQEKEEAEARKLAEEAKEADRVAAAKRAAVDDMLDALCDYLMAVEAHDMLEGLHEVDTDKVIDMLDGTIRFARSLEAMKNLEFQEVDRKNDIVGHFFGLLG